MRVMLVAQWFPPIIGGEERHVLNLGRTLLERGHDVSVVTLRQPGLATDETVDGLRVHRIEGTVQRFDRLFLYTDRKSAAPIPDPELVASFRRLLAEERPDIVHGHNWLIHPVLALKPVTRIPTVVTLHDFSLVCARKDHMFFGAVDCTGPAPKKCLRCAARHYGPAKGIVTYAGTATMRRVAMATVDRFIAVSDSVAEGNLLADGHVPYDVIPNFIPDADPTSSEPASDGAATVLPDEPFILYVGAISRVKGVPALLQAYRGLDRPPPLVLIGYPGADTESILRELPDGAVVLASQPHATVLAAWRRSRIAVVPSVCRDASPTVVLEAMAAGLPVVASRIGGIPDMIESEVNGLLVEPGDARALGRALDRVITDEGLASRLAVAAVGRAKAFTASSVVPRIESVYQQVLSEHGRAA